MSFKDEEFCTKVEECEFGDKIVLKRPVYGDGQRPENERPEKRPATDDSYEGPGKRTAIGEDFRSQSHEGPGFGNVVASHYNKLEEKGKAQRKNSRIFHMRNFNNWVKSMLINEYLDKLKASDRYLGSLRVLDLGMYVLLSN